MDQPYERAICLKLLTLVAENLTLKFEQFEYEPPPSSSSVSTAAIARPGTSAASSAPRPSTATSGEASGATSASSGARYPITLRQEILKIPYEQQASQDRELVEQLQVVIKAAEDINLAKELFAKFDADHSGALDLEELQVLITHLSPAIEAAALEEVRHSPFPSPPPSPPLPSCPSLPTSLALSYSPLTSLLTLSLNSSDLF
jgi:hypothetical protein